MVRHAQDPWQPEEPDYATVRAQQKTSSHLIVNGLFLGNARGFAQTCGLPVKDADAVTGKPFPLDTNNPYEFEAVVTVCPIIDMASDFCDFAEIGNVEEQLVKSFADRKITWLYVGKAVTDDVHAWDSLVHDCTFDTSLASSDIRGLRREQFSRIEERKARVLSECMKMEGYIERLFEPVFEELDKAVFEGKKTLVHCHAGISRSATVLAAYLINRFDVTSDQAIAFLRSHRICVNPNPKFKEELTNYAKALSAYREKA